VLSHTEGSTTHLLVLERPFDLIISTMNPDIQVTLKRTKPQPMFLIQLWRIGETEPVSTSHTYADFVLLKEDLKAEIEANPSLEMPEFPKRKGVRFSSVDGGELEERTAALDAWMARLGRFNDAGRRGLKLDYFSLPRHVSFLGAQLP